MVEKKFAGNWLPSDQLWLLKKDTRTSYFKSKEPHPKLERPFLQYEVPLAKKNTNNALNLYGSSL